MTHEEVKALVKQNNDSIDYFINVELATKLGAKNGMIKTEQWFKAQQLIKEKNFYKTSMQLLENLREQGFDVKIDMQSYKLVY